MSTLFKKKKCRPAPPKKFLYSINLYELDEDREGMYYKKHQFASVNFLFIFKEARTMAEQVEKKGEDSFCINLGLADQQDSVNPDDAKGKVVFEIPLRIFILFFLKESGSFGLRSGSPFDKWEDSLIRRLGHSIDPGAILQEIEALKKDGYIISKYRQAGTCSKADFLFLAPGVKLEIK